MRTRTYGAYAIEIAERKIIYIADRRQSAEGSAAFCFGRNFRTICKHVWKLKDPAAILWASPHSNLTFALIGV